MRNILFTFIMSLTTFFIAQVCYAETCPSVEDIKHQKLAAGWHAYDSEDGKPLPPARMAQLITYIDQFALAEWSSNKRAGGIIHCYYRDKHGSDLEAYFSKEHFKPDNGKNVWYQVSGHMHCAAGMDKCTFNTNSTPIAPQKQFAKK